MILTLRTDKPVSEVGLFDGNKQIAYVTWDAHRQLAETIHQKIDAILTANKNKLQDITGVIVYKGPGSFTGLRIGISVANGLAYGLEVPIIGSTGDEWIRAGVLALSAKQDDTSVVPEYGAAAHVTQPRK